MHLSTTARELYEEIARLEIVDGHEHLPTERAYLAQEYSGPNLFAGGYIQHDLRSAGLDPAFVATLRDPGYRPVEDWWPKIRPYWEHVKHTSYARALRVTARDVFGVDDVSDATIGSIAEQVRADNTPGIYARNLRERCRIERVLCISDDPAGLDDETLRGVYPILWIEQRDGGTLLRSIPGADAASMRTLEDAGAAVQKAMREAVRAGAVGFKIRVADFGKPDDEAAAKEMKAALGGEGKAPAVALRDWLFDRALDVAAEAAVPVAVHTGYWGDFRELDPKLMLGFALRRSDVRFDLFHLGVPMYRDAALIGKSLPNVTLNLTWCPVISQVQTKRTLDELIDLVPANKVIAFGGDYRVAVQKVYGHLVLAREVVAASLADRVAAGDFDRARAMELAAMWFSGNPRRVYRLD